MDWSKQFRLLEMGCYSECARDIDRVQLVKMNGAQMEEETKHVFFYIIDTVVIIYIFWTCLLHVEEIIARQHRDIYLFFTGFFSSSQETLFAGVHD